MTLAVKVFLVLMFQAAVGEPPEFAQFERATIEECIADAAARTAGVPKRNEVGIFFAGCKLVVVPERSA